MSAIVVSPPDRAMGRSVLASLAGSAGDRAALDTAIAIARRDGGHITCLHTRIEAVEATAALEMLFPRIGLLSAMQQIEKEETLRSERAQQTFDEACRRQGVPPGGKHGESAALSLSWKEMKSFSDDTLEEARYHDLVVTNVVDATVDAHLKGFDVSDNLSLQFKAGYSPLAQTNAECSELLTACCLPGFG